MSPFEDPEGAIATANAAREATELEYVRLEALQRRRDEHRASVLRSALEHTPALADGLRKRGVVRSARELGRLADELAETPLDLDPTDERRVLGDETLSAVLRDLHVERRGEHASVVGELAARRAKLEERRKALLMDHDRNLERRRRYEVALKQRREAEAEERNARIAAGEPVSGDENERSTSSLSSSEDFSDSDEEARYRQAREFRKRKKQQRLDALARSRSSALLTRQRANKASDASLKAKQVIVPRDHWDSDSVGSDDSFASLHRPSSPFLLDRAYRGELSRLSRREVELRVRREMGYAPDETRVPEFVPTRAKERLLAMKLAHSGVAARLRYLASAESYEREGVAREGKSDAFGGVQKPQMSAGSLRASLESESSSARMVRAMCRELATEICDSVADVFASRPTAERLRRERAEWERRVAPRRLAMCRQLCDDVVRRVVASEAEAVVLEMEANHAAAAGFVAKAIATAVMRRLDGDAANRLTFPGGEEAGAEAEAESGKNAAKKDSAKKEQTKKSSGGWFGGGGKSAASKGGKAANNDSDAEDAGDFSFAGGVDLGGGADSEEYWSTSSSDEEDDFARRTATDRHACQHMLNEMQRRRPPGLVFHHTQPLREASPPPGVGRGRPRVVIAPAREEKTKKKQGSDGSDGGGSPSESSSGSSDGSGGDSSDSSDSSDSEAEEEKRRVAAAMARREQIALADAKARAHPPPRSGVANLGVLAEPPPTNQSHRAAHVEERRYWEKVRVVAAFEGKKALEVRGAVTSLAAVGAGARAGAGPSLAAGTSKGEVIVWRFPPPPEEPSEDEGESTEKDAKKKKKKKTPSSRSDASSSPVVVARAKCSAHPLQDKGAGGKEKDENGVEGDPSALYTAVTSVEWSADGSQMCSAERGGVSRMWTLAAGSAGAGSNDSDAEDNNAGTHSKLRMGETMVLAGKNHATSSPVEDPDPPPADDDAPTETDPSAKKGGGKKPSAKELEKALAERRERAEAAARERRLQRERWPRDARTLTRFFPAFTVAGRQPYAMFTRPNGDIVRASPTLRPAAVVDANVAGARVSGKIMRELEMFRGAKSWAKGNVFKAVERQKAKRENDGGGLSSGDDSGDDDAAAGLPGMSTIAPTTRLDNADQIGRVISRKDTGRPGWKNRKGGGGASALPVATAGSRARVTSHKHRDGDFVLGDDFVAGCDDLLDACETFAGGAGGRMGAPERARLLKPEIDPVFPGNKPAPKEGAYAQDLYRGHDAPVVFLDVLPDSGSMLSVDAAGTVCVWPAFQGGKARSGFGWYAPLGSWKLPGEVTAQVPAGTRVSVGSGGGSAPDVSKTHHPWMTGYSKKGTRVAHEAPKDKRWVKEDEKALRAVEAIARPRTYAEELELAPVKRRLKIPGVDDEIETAEARWRRINGESGGLGSLDVPVGADGVSEIGEDVSVVIPYEESRDYFVSQYDAKTGALIQRHRQRHVTRRAKAEVVGAAIADSGGVPDLIVVRRISGLPRAAAAAGGIDAAMAAVPYFTAHAYSLDDMRPTAPRCDMPNPFAPPKGRGGDAKQGAGSAKAKTPEDLERALEKAARGFGDPAPYPFALLKATPSLGTEHLVAPIGAGAIGVFSLATGAMVADAELPGMPSGEHVAELRVLHDYHHPGAAASEKGEGPGGGGAAPGVNSRCLLAVAGSGGGRVRLYALDEGKAQITRVMRRREETARGVRELGAPSDQDGRRDEEESESESESESGSESGSEGSSGDGSASEDARGRGRRR